MNKSIKDLNYQIIKRENSIGSSFNSSISLKQAQSIEIKDQSDSQILSNYSKKGSDSQEQQSTGQYMQQGSDLFQSITLSTKFSCAYCHFDIDENAIITPCQHAFHQNCLKEQINKELSKKEHFIKCVCGFELNQMLKHYFHFRDKQIYKDIIKFEINNIRKNIRRELIIDCEGGPYKQESYDNQYNIVYKEKQCNSFYIVDLELEIPISGVCVVCGRHLLRFDQQNDQKYKLQ